MKAPAHVKSPEQYIASLPAPRRVAIQTLHDGIRAVVPQLDPVIVYGMLGYGHFHYKYASGREGDSAIIALASQKNYISLYLSACDGDLAEKNQDRLGKVSVGKCCIRFKKLEDLNLKGAMQLVKKAAQLAKKPGGLAM